MSKSAKNWLITAASLVAAGLIIFVSVMAAYHWDFSRLSTDRFESNTYEINEKFSNIKLNTGTADIHFAESDDNICRVVCCEEEKTKHSVSVKDGTLTVSVKDNRKWYEHIGINFRSPEITVYLPLSEYASLTIEASTGDIVITDKFKFDSAYISLSTGGIKLDNISADTLDLFASTGEITLSSVTCKGDIKVSVTTGDVKMTDVKCKSLKSTGSTSDISLKNVIAAGKFSVERSTGNVRFDGSDAAEISVKASTGDVTGSLLTEKVFVAETSTGYISVPKTKAGGKCKITTSTGNIKIKISNGAGV